MITNGGPSRAMREDYPYNKKALLLLEKLKIAPPGPVCEIGCIRSSKYDPDDGYSTYFLASLCEKVGRPFYSYDIQTQAVEIANSVLRVAGLQSKVEVASGTEALKLLPPLAYLLLDSHKNPFISFEQYAAATLLPGAILVVDDAMRIEGWDYGKATCIKQIFDKNSMPYEIIPTNTGWASFVAVITKGKRAGELI